MLWKLEWGEPSGRIQIDTARRCSFTPYIAELQENSDEIGSVYEHERPVFISEMPTIAYCAETTEAEKSESQVLRLKEYPAMKNIYLAAGDLDNYGFDVINEDSGKTLYINRNPSKAIGMMDGGLVNSRVGTERVSPLYPAKKHVMMNGVEIFRYSMENKTLIPMTELAPYHMRLNNVYHTINAYRLDI